MSATIAVHSTEYDRDLRAIIHTILSGVSIPDSAAASGYRRRETTIDDIRKDVVTACMEHHKITSMVYDDLRTMLVSEYSVSARQSITNDALRLQLKLDR